MEMRKLTSNRCDFSSSIFTFLSVPQVPKDKWFSTGPQPEGGNRAIAPRNFQKRLYLLCTATCLHHFAPPPEKLSWLRPWFSMNQTCDSKSRYKTDITC